MRKLAIALGVTAAVALAGGFAWNADAASWRSGTSGLPAAAKALFAGRAGGLLRPGPLVPDRMGAEMRPLEMQMRALLVGR
jgi:hypothetical protein